MGRQRDILDAERQAAEDNWKCRTCDAPADEHGPYCTQCRMYWDDVESGLFEDWPTEINNGEPMS